MGGEAELAQVLFKLDTEPVWLGHPCVVRCVAVVHRAQRAL